MRWTSLLCAPSVLRPTKGPYSTAASRRIIRQILQQEPFLGLGNHQLYKAVTTQFANARETEYTLPSELYSHLKGKPRDANHPIRSMAFMKKSVLLHMEDRGLIERVRLVRGISPRDGSPRSDLVFEPNSSRGPVKVPEIHDLSKPNEWRWRLKSGTEQAKWDKLDEEKTAFFDVEALRNEAKTALQDSHSAKQTPKVRTSRKS